MPCFSPLSAWRGDVGVSGKRAVVFDERRASRDVDQSEIKLPDGQCIGCRLDYAIDWSVRCMCEVQMHARSCFITCTYEKCPPDGSLSLRHWQLFMKLLRAEVGPVRFFHAGEYGTLNGRPHDHALIFGFDFPDRVYFKVTGSGSKIYTSALLAKLWKSATDGLGGYCSVGDATFESAGYLARYLIGRPTLRRKIRDENDVVIGRKFTDEAIARYGEKVDSVTGEVSLVLKPEYLTMSRSKGIGYSWFMKYGVPDVFPRDYVILRNGVKFPPPRYFDILYEEKNPLDFERIKIDRMSRNTEYEEVWNKYLEKLQVLDVKRPDRLKVMAEVKKAQVSFLKKSLEVV